MPLKIAMIVLPPLMVTIVVLSLVGASWDAWPASPSSWSPSSSSSGYATAWGNSQLLSPWPLLHRSRRPSGLARLPSPVSQCTSTRRRAAAAVTSAPSASERWSQRRRWSNYPCARTCSTKGASTCGCGLTGRARCAVVLSSWRLRRRAWRSMCAIRTVVELRILL